MVQFHMASHLAHVHDCLENKTYHSSPRNTTQTVKENLQLALDLNKEHKIDQTAKQFIT